MQPMSFKERFLGLGNGNQQFAPSTLGAPQYTTQVDYSTFKKSLKERVETENIKKKHKREMVKYYGKGKVGKRLNISPE